MKVQVLQENLYRGLGVVGKAVEPRSVLSVAQNILLKTDEGRLRLSATGYDITVTTWIGTQIEEEGATTIPARLLQEFVAKLPASTVSVDTTKKDNRVALSCDRITADMATMDAELFPKTAEVEGGMEFEVDANDLASAIKRVHFAAAPDTARPVLAGVHMGTRDGAIRLAAADGFRLAIQEILQNTDGLTIDTIIPTRAMRELHRLISDSNETVKIKIAPDSSRMKFVVGEIEIVTQLIHGQFPNYDSLIPTGSNTTTTVHASDLARGVGISSVFASAGSGIVRLTGEGSTLVVGTNGEESGNNSGEIEAQIQGEPLKIAFNNKYLGDVLSVVDGELSLSTESPSQQGVFRIADDDTYTHIIMPMFVQW